MHELTDREKSLQIAVVNDINENVDEFLVQARNWMDTRKAASTQFREFDIPWGPFPILTKALISVRFFSKKPGGIAGQQMRLVSWEEASRVMKATFPIFDFSAQKLKKKWRKAGCKSAVIQAVEIVSKSRSKTSSGSDVLPENKPPWFDFFMERFPQLVENLATTPSSSTNHRMLPSVSIGSIPKPLDSVSASAMEPAVKRQRIEDDYLQDGEQRTANEYFNSFRQELSYMREHVRFIQERNHEDVKRSKKDAGDIMQLLRVLMNTLNTFIQENRTTRAEMQLVLRDIRGAIAQPISSTTLPPPL